MAIFLSSISIGLAIAIFAIQQVQSKDLKEIADQTKTTVTNTNEVAAKTKELTAKVAKITSEIGFLLEGKRQRIANILVSRIDLFLAQKEKLKKLHQKHQTETNPNEISKLGFQIQDEHVRITKFLETDISDAEMLDTFKEPVPSLYRTLRQKAMLAASYDPKTEGIDPIINHLEELETECKNLRDKLELFYSKPFSSTLKKDSK